MIVFNNLRNHVFPELWQRTVEPKFPGLHSLLLLMLSKRPNDRPTADVVASKMRSILEGFTVTSLDKNVHATTAILLRVESKTREDVLPYTIQLFKEAVSPTHGVEIVQYGLRSGINRTIMEFAIDFSESGSCNNDNSSGGELKEEPVDVDTTSSSVNNKTESGKSSVPSSVKSQLANTLVTKVSSDDDILLIRQVTAKKYA